MFSILDPVIDPSAASLNKSASDLLSLAHLSTSQNPLSPSITTINAPTLPSMPQVKSHIL